MIKKEIHSREADGISVSLFAHFASLESDIEYDIRLSDWMENPIGEAPVREMECIEISCEVCDSRRGIEFVISDIPKDKALEAFNHPFAMGERVLLTGAIS